MWASCDETAADERFLSWPNCVFTVICNAHLNDFSIVQPKPQLQLKLHYQSLVFICRLIYPTGWGGNNIIKGKRNVKTRCCNRACLSI